MTVYSFEKVTVYKSEPIKQEILVIFKWKLLITEVRGEMCTGSIIYLIETEIYFQKDLLASIV